MKNTWVLIAHRGGAEEGRVGKRYGRLVLAAEAHFLGILPPIDRYHPPRSASEAVGCMALLGGVV